MIFADTRQQKDKHISNYFNKNDINWARTKLFAGDYQLANSTKIIIDTKKDLMEMCGNLARTSEHNRIKAEIDRAKSIGCKKFVFLIAEDYISNIDDVHKWRVPLNWKTKKPRTQVKPETLQKIMKTMSEKYEVEFVFCRKEEMGKKIIEILEERSF